MRTLRILLAVLLPLTLLAACGDDDDSATTAASGAKPTTTTTTAGGDTSAADHVFTADDNQKDVSVKVGETFDITLESCLTCGYHWAPVKGTPNDYSESDIVTFLSEEDVQRDQPAGQTGGPSDYTAHFRATSAGGANVELGYYPPGKTDAEDSVIITVNVTA